MGGCSVRFGEDYVCLAGVLHGKGELFYCHIAESQQCRVCGCLGLIRGRGIILLCGKVIRASRLAVLRAIFIEVGA